MDCDDANKVTLENLSDTDPPKETITGVIFRKTIRASYASLDLIEVDGSGSGSGSGDGDKHIMVIVQLNDDKENISSSRSYIRRECKLGSQIELDGFWEKNRFKVALMAGADVNDDINDANNSQYTGLRLIKRQKIDMIECQKAREKFYPTFDKTNKQKVRVDVHNSNGNGSGQSMSKKKRKDTEGVGHGGGLGKKRQGEIVRDFVFSLIHQDLQRDIAQEDTRAKVNSTDIVNEQEHEQEQEQEQVHGQTHHNQVPTDEKELNRVINFLNKGSGVLDVAGGSGHLSLAFSSMGIKSTVVDPRKTVGKLPGRDRKALKRLIKNSKEGSDSGSGSRIKILPPPIEFSSLRAWFAKRPEGIDVEFREGLSQADEGTAVEPIPICSMCSKDNLLPQCSTIVALHPDEATGDIVDFAVTHRIPFVIVPCCVFSRLFPMRFKPLKEGNDVIKRQLVSTYDDLIEFLASKDDSIQISKLDFDGANTVLWSTFSKSKERK